MYDSAFTPQLGGLTVLVGTTAIQVPTIGAQGMNQGLSYRIRCMATGYISFSPTVGTSPDQAPTNFAANTPTAQGALNVIGMTTGQTEVFTLPELCWFVSSVAGGFEVTCGEGQ